MKQFTSRSNASALLRSSLIRWLAGCAVVASWRAHGEAHVGKLEVFEDLVGCDLGCVVVVAFPSEREGFVA